jgi:uncharacterized repeat protein (TIGR04076 family)
VLPLAWALEERIFMLFQSLSTFQFGGNFPWWKGDTIEVRCPDPHNLVTLQLQRFSRG